MCYDLSMKANITIQTAKQKIDTLFKVDRVLAIIMFILIILGVIFIYNPVLYNITTIVSFAFFLYFRVCFILFVVHIVALVILLKNNIKEKNILFKLLKGFILAISPPIVYILIFFFMLSSSYGTL